MLATSHALIAGVILKTFPDPKIALPMALVSHFILDLVPHWDATSGINNGSEESRTLVGKKNLPKIIFSSTVDILLGFGLTYWLFAALDPTMLFIAIVVSQLPDWLQTPYYFWGIKFAPSIWSKKIQKIVHFKARLPWGLLTQIAVIVPLLWWALT